MRTLIATLIVILSAGTIVAQTETKGKRVEIDSATGQRKTTYLENVQTEQDVTPRNNMIVINPLKFFLYYNVSYYRKLNKSTVVGLGVQMPTLSGISGFGVNGEVRFHPSAKAMRGFYIAPNASYNYMKTTYSNFWDGSSGEATTGNATIGGLLGWQWFPGDDFAMGLGIGVDYNFLTGTANADHFSNYSGTTPALRFDIGYAWE